MSSNLSVDRVYQGINVNKENTRTRMSIQFFKKDSGLDLDYLCNLPVSIVYVYVSKNKMVDPKLRFEILPSLSILLKFSNGAVFRSLITSLVLVFQKKKWRIQNGDYNMYNVPSFS
jgi:hypothetical protein